MTESYPAGEFPYDALDLAIYFQILLADHEKLKDKKLEEKPKENLNDIDILLDEKEKNVKPI